jgi:N-acetylglucosaminyl-diphospho-decaprenol L-rhamnosyltransferase
MSDMGQAISTGGVSIVIPHYGDPSLAIALLADLDAQTTTRPLQIIVADDHSPEPFPSETSVSCEIVRRDSNGGFGAAVNAGAAVGVHPMLLILNSDLRIGPEFIDDLCRAATPWMPAIIGPALVDEHGSVTHSARRFPRLRSSAIAVLVPLARWRRTDRWHRAVGHLTPAPTSGATVCDWVEGAALLMPTELFRELGGFDERFFMYSEEVDLQTRARLLGIPSVVLGDVSAIHSGGGSSDTTKRFAWLIQGEWIYAEKWRGRGAARRYQAVMFGAFLVNLVWNTFRRALGRDSQPLASFAQNSRSIRHAPSR